MTVHSLEQHRNEIQRLSNAVNKMLVRSAEQNEQMHVINAKLKLIEQHLLKSESKFETFKKYCQFVLPILFFTMVVGDLLDVSHYLEHLTPLMSLL